MKKATLAMLIQEGGKLISEIMRAQPRHSLPKTEATPQGGQVESRQPHKLEIAGSIPAPATKRVTTKETIRYQRREIGKELLLLEKHLQQGCKIAGKDGQPVACDCCGGKHMVTLEALAQETLGMTSDPALTDLIQWVGEVEPKTTEEASASGKYDAEYPRLAIRARQLRKSVMGTESAGALLAEKEVKDADTISPTPEPKT